MSQELTSNSTKPAIYLNAVNELQHGPSKRYHNTVIPKRGSRKKTLSLNPEEREALENLVEEVIIDGGMGDSESGSSDDEENVQNNNSPSKKSQSSQNETASGEPKSTTYKMPKKYYPGQLKVALKHMTDLPPRFSRKLKKAEKYLEINATHKKVMASSSIKEEDEDESSNISVSTISTSTPNSTNQTTSSGLEDTSSMSNSDVNSLNCSFNGNSNNNSLNKQKPVRDRLQKDDLKKTIRSLLTDLDQYVDENDRASISLDLPGAVSCSDLEKDSLQQISTTHLPSSQISLANVDQNNNKRNFNVKAKLEHSPGYYNEGKVKKNITTDNLSMTKDRTNAFSYAGLSPNYYHSPPSLSTSTANSKYHSIGTLASNQSYHSTNMSIMSGSENCTSSFSQSESKPINFPASEYSSTNSNFMEQNPPAPFVMPVTQLVPSLIPPNLTFPQSPQGPFTYSTPPSHYATPNQVSFDSSSIKYDPHFGGYIDYSMGGIVCPPMNNVMPNEMVRPNYSVGFQMTPVVFQQLSSPPQALSSNFSYGNNPGAFVNQFSFPPPSLPGNQVHTNGLNHGQQNMQQSTPLPNVLNLDLSTATSNFKNKPNEKVLTSPLSSGMNKFNNSKILPVTNFNKPTNGLCITGTDKSSTKSKEKEEVLKSEMVNSKPLISVSTPSLIMDSESSKLISGDEKSADAIKKIETPVKNKDEPNYLKTTFAEDIGTIKSIINSASESNKKSPPVATASQATTQVSGCSQATNNSKKATVTFDLAPSNTAEPVNTTHQSIKSDGKPDAKPEVLDATKQSKYPPINHLSKHSNYQPINKVTNQSNYQPLVNQSIQQSASFSLNNIAPTTSDLTSVAEIGESLQTAAADPLVHKLDALINGAYKNAHCLDTTTVTTHNTDDGCAGTNKETVLSFCDIPIQERKSDIQLLNLSTKFGSSCKFDSDDCTGFVVKLDDCFIDKLINLFIKDKNDGRDEEIKSNIKKKMKDQVFLNKDLLKEIFNLLSTNKDAVN